MANITLELMPSFYVKTDPKEFEEAIQYAMENSSERLLELIKEECPVRTGNLRDGHHITHGMNWINISNNVYYWKYVVWRGNDYIDRGLLRFIGEQIIEDAMTLELFKRGMI